MKKQLAMLWTISAVVGLLVIGCQKSTDPTDEAPPAGVTDEISAMKYEAENDEFVKNDELMFADQAVLATDYAYVSGFVSNEITPLRWGRFVTSVTRTVSTTILPGDTISIAHVHKVINGVLKIKALRGTDTVLIEKPFSDESDRNKMFKRVQRNPRRYWKNWKVVATSLVEGGTPNGQIEITKVEMVTRSGRTITITDPQTFYLRYRWLGYRNGSADMAELNGGDSVKVRVTLLSSSPDTDLVALRFGFNSLYKNRAKMNLVSQSGNTKVYERTFYVHNRPGFFHAAIDAATKATLFDDDTTKYAVSWWGVPYKVF